MKTYKIITKGFSATICTDEKSIESILKLLDNLNHIVEIYSLEDKGYQLVKRIQLNIKNDNR
jgi:hypothetical protein